MPSVFGELTGLTIVTWLTVTFSQRMGVNGPTRRVDQFYPAIKTFWHRIKQIKRGRW